MIYQRQMIPTTDGAQIALDVYASTADRDINPQKRRPAVLICPGGGYAFCSPREAEPVALRFVALGFHAFVVWYRTAPSRFPAPQQDAAAALAHIRRCADDWYVDPDRIAILGFSAGGHLAGSLGALWHHADLWEPLGLTPEQVRPNAMVLCYPVITGGEWAHRGSFDNLTGTTDAARHPAYSVDGWVTEHCPPTFLWHTFTDGSVPVQNSLLMAQALAKHGIAAELHIYPNGGHGASLCSDLTTHEGTEDTHTIPEAQGWPELAARFLNGVMR